MTSILKNHISRYGSILVEQLYETPFTTLHSEGLDGVFSDEQMVEELLDIINLFKKESITIKDRGYDIT